MTQQHPENANGQSEERYQALEQETYLNLVRTSEVLTAQLDTLLKEHGLTLPLYNALRVVAGGPDEGLPTLTVAQRMLSRDPDMTRLADRLEQLNAVVRSRCEHDRRVIRLKLTEGGAALLARLRVPLDTLYRAMLGHMSPEALAQFNVLLYEARRPHGD